MKRLRVGLRRKKVSDSQLRFKLRTFSIDMRDLARSNPEVALRITGSNKVLVTWMRSQGIQF